MKIDGSAASARLALNRDQVPVFTSEGYEGDAFQATYAIGPIPARVLDVTVDFDRAPKKLDDIKIRNEPAQTYLDALQTTGRIVRAISSDRVGARTMSKAATDALRAVDLDSAAEDVPAEMKKR